MTPLLDDNLERCMQTATTEIKPDTKVILKIDKATLNSLLISKFLK
jgi:hypothetical protein